MSDTVPDHPTGAVGEDFEDEFPDARSAATLCAVNLLRTSDCLLAELDRRRRPIAPLSATAFEILAILEGAGEPLSPRVISTRLIVTSGTMTSLLDTLERRGLIKRVPHPSDRRKLLIEITDEARDIVDRMLPRVHGASRDAFATLSDAECETFLELLERVQAQLHVLEQEARPDSDERRVTQEKWLRGAKSRTQQTPHEKKGD